MGVPIDMHREESVGLVWAWGCPWVVVGAGAAVVGGGAVAS